MKSGLKILIVVVLLNGFIAGCGGDEVVDYADAPKEMGDATARLLEEFSGEYELIRWIISYNDGSKSLDRAPPEITGFMTIDLHRSLRQEFEWRGDHSIVEGSFEISPDEEIMRVRLYEVVIIVVIYSWDGSTFTTTMNSNNFSETWYWRKV